MHCNNKFLQGKNQKILLKNFEHCKQTYRLSSLFSRKKKFQGEKLFQTTSKQQILCERPCKLKKKLIFFPEITTKGDFRNYFLMHIFF